MSAEHPPLPHSLSASLRDMQSAYETLLSLAHQQYAYIQSDDIAGLRLVLERKAALIAEIDSFRDMLLRELARINVSPHAADVLAQWRVKTHELLSELYAVDRQSVESLQQRLRETSPMFSLLAQARRLLAAYHPASNAPVRHRYINRRL